MAQTGSYVPTLIGGRPFQAFVPNPLPPKPPIELSREDHKLINDANRALGRLDMASDLLPNPKLLVYFYVRKEALLSSQIEGTQSTFPDLLLSESENAPEVPSEDIADVSRYVAAMELGLQRIREDGFSLSLGLIKEMHALLLSTGRGRSMKPGMVRSEQNYIGAKGRPRFIPPPPERVLECLENLESYVNDRTEEPLVRAALAHVQFETIHPFSDGNGRLGRLLITLILCMEKVIREPLLYLSLYFKENRLDYFDHLDRVRTRGDWIGWLRFYLNGICETADRATATTQAIRQQFETDRILLTGSRRRTIHLYETLKMQPIVTTKSAGKLLRVEPPTARKAIRALEELGILREVTGKKRGRIHQYDPYVKILSEGAEPIEQE